MFNITGGLYGNYRMIRNPDKTPGGQSCVFIGDKQEYDIKKFVPCPVKKGIGVILSYYASVDYYLYI